MEGAKQLEISSDEVAYLIELASEDLESERRVAGQLAIATFDGAAEVHRRFDTGSFGAHEALDRLNLFAENVEQHALAHPTIGMNREAFWRVRLACLLLRDAYQKVGAAEPKQ